MMDDRIPQVDPYPVPTRRLVAWVTCFLVGSTVAVFLLQLLELHRYGEDLIGDALAFSPQAMADHRYWTLLTYAWVHAVAMFGDSGFFWLHLVSNMIPLICLGPALEEILGHGRYLGLYLGGAVASALAWLAFSSYSTPITDSDPGIIGASGAVFAVIAAIGTAMPREGVTVFLFYFLSRMSMRIVALTACGVEVASILFHWLPEVAHSAHLGGAAFGFLYVMAFRPRQRDSVFVP